LRCLRGEILERRFSEGIYSCIHDA
jgi:hypothetical protein